MRFWNGGKWGLAALLILCMLLVPLFAGAEDAAPEIPRATEAPEKTGETLATGSKGEAVVSLQARLKELGYLQGEADGDFGNATRSALRSFQRRNDLEADGIAGPLTLARLYAEDAISAPDHPEPTDVIHVELPVLVNREHPVDEYFLPADLVLLQELCPSSLVRIKYPKTQGVRTAVEALVALLEAAHEEKITKWQVSAGYRTWDSQVSMLNAKISSYLKRNSGWSRSRARKAALRTVAEPGASEHHLGLAFDVNVPGTDAFRGTKQCAWLHAHCWEYGFIIRYPEGKEAITGFDAEAWHIRYVGKDHSLYMRDHDLCLEEYLQGIEDGSIVPEKAEIWMEETLPDEE